MIALKQVVFPAPFGPDQAEDLAAADLEADVVEGGQTAELDGEAVGAQQRFAHRGLDVAGRGDRLRDGVRVGEGRVDRGDVDDGRRLGGLGWRLGWVGRHVLVVVEAAPPAPGTRHFDVSGGVASEATGEGSADAPPGRPAGRR